MGHNWTQMSTFIAWTVRNEDAEQKKILQNMCCDCLLWQYRRRITTPIFWAGEQSDASLGPKWHSDSPTDRPIYKDTRTDRKGISPVNQAALRNARLNSSSMIGTKRMLDISLLELHSLGDQVAHNSNKSKEFCCDSFVVVIVLSFNIV